MSKIPTDKKTRWPKLMVFSRNNLGASPLTVHRFRVQDKEGIKDPKFSLKMLIFPNNCQFGSKTMDKGL